MARRRGERTRMETYWELQTVTGDHDNMIPVGIDRFKQNPLYPIELGCAVLEITIFIFTL